MYVYYITKNVQLRSHHLHMHASHREVRLHRPAWNLQQMPSLISGGIHSIVLVEKDNIIVLVAEFSPSRVRVLWVTPFKGAPPWYSRAMSLLFSPHPLKRITAHWSEGHIELRGHTQQLKCNSRSDETARQIRRKCKTDYKVGVSCNIKHFADWIIKWVWGCELLLFITWGELYYKNITVSFCDKAQSNY